MPCVHGDCMFQNEWLKDDKLKFKRSQVSVSGATDIYKIAKCSNNINYEVVLIKRRWMIFRETVKRLRCTILCRVLQVFNVLGCL